MALLRSARVHDVVALGRSSQLPRLCSLCTCHAVADRLCRLLTRLCLSCLRARSPARPLARSSHFAASRPLAAAPDVAHTSLTHSLSRLSACSPARRRLTDFLLTRLAAIAAGFQSQVEQCGPLPVAHPTHMLAPRRPRPAKQPPPTTKHQHFPSQTVK